MNKTEIRVTIDDTAKQQKAIEILERYKQRVWEDSTAMYFDKDWKNLVFDGEDWFISDYQRDTEITLYQLEGILKNEKK